MEVTVVLNEDEIMDMVYELNDARAKGLQSGMYEKDGISFQLVPTDNEKLKNLRSLLGK